LLLARHRQLSGVKENENLINEQIPLPVDRMTKTPASNAMNLILLDRSTSSSITSSTPTWVSLKQNMPFESERRHQMLEAEQCDGEPGGDDFPC